MNPKNKNQLFRLSAVLYADNNYIVSSKTTLRKIIETGLFAIERDSVSFHELIDFIFDNYNLHIDEAEIQEVINSAKQDSFLTNQIDGNQILSLTEKRKVQIQAKIDENTIEYFIEIYLKEIDVSDTSNDLKELIYRFLYDILSTNVESFKKLIDKENTIEALINIDNHSYSLEERELINGFLKWDNSDKNKSVFDIASFAIEYCLVSNHSKQGLELNNLKNKTFYLDTNVLFRALGINGEDRQKRTKTFLTRFQESKTELLISKYTDKEFRDTIEYYIQRLGNKPFKNKVNPTLFRHKFFTRLKDIYNYYYNWRVGKQNHSLDLFKADILAKYQAFSSKMEIKIDYRNVLDEEDKDIKEKLADYVSSINTHKTGDTNTSNYNGYEFDAKNILLLENLRQSKNQSIFDTKQFFLSTDQSLRRWDFQRGSRAPLVIMPSQWMSLLLRYQSRTTDDFKSFVSFLNLPIPEKQISSENIHNVLAGISEVTSNFEQQAFIGEQLIEQGFEKIMQKTQDSDELFRLTIEASESILEKKLNELESEQKELAKSSNNRIQKLEEHNQSKESIIGQKDTEIERLKKEKYSLHEKEELRKFKKPANIFWIPLAIILTIIVLLCFVFRNENWNYISQFINSIDEEKSTTRQWMYRIGISAFITIGIFGLISASYKRLAKNKIEDYKDKIKTRYKE
jgi:cyanate lyase